MDILDLKEHLEHSSAKNKGYMLSHNFTYDGITIVVSIRGGNNIDREALSVIWNDVSADIAQQIEYGNE